MQTRIFFTAHTTLLSKHRHTHTHEKRNKKQKNIGNESKKKVINSKHWNFVAHWGRWINFFLLPVAFCCFIFLGSKKNVCVILVECVFFCNFVSKTIKFLLHMRFDSTTNRTFYTLNANGYLWFIFCSVRLRFCITTELWTKMICRLFSKYFIEYTIDAYVYVCTYGYWSQYAYTMRLLATLVFFSSFFSFWDLCVGLYLLIVKFNEDEACRHIHSTVDAESHFATHIFSILCRRIHILRYFFRLRPVYRTTNESEMLFVEQMFYLSFMHATDL